MSAERKKCIDSTKRLMFFSMDYLAFFPILLTPFFASKNFFIGLLIYFVFCSIIAIFRESPVRLAKQGVATLSNNCGRSTIDKETWHPSNLSDHIKFDQ